MTWEMAIAVVGTIALGVWWDCKRWVTLVGAAVGVALIKLVG